MDNSEEEYDKHFGNWVKCCIALRCLKSGLLSFVDSEVKQIHETTLRQISSLCSVELVHCAPCVASRKCNHAVKLDCETCKVKHCADIIKQHPEECSWVACEQCKDMFCSKCARLKHVLKVCECMVNNTSPSQSSCNCLNANCSSCNCYSNSNANTATKTSKFKVCDHVYDALRKQHENGKPTLVNCDPKLWKNDHWEFAKWFINTPGYVDKKAPEDLDAAALLSVCINLKSLHSSIQNIKTFQEVSTLVLYGVNKNTLRSTNLNFVFKHKIPKKC